ncbi:fatty-acyl-CoA synthase [Actinocorallia herbida]|uniref:Fatty-acyl-CoA synthase n=1 Tax=Actinocorallia herbida TaxID=58109 RepID=A0A3N1D2G9_9ACTN|nr:long-chain fatty acid--CoA ligase [Actinocorallia herbida]ROO87268.1 fatty-acyl-CoA synthase [Actinocorallia herbida]
MKSTMMDTPLGVAAILRHGARWHSGRKVVTMTGPGEWRESAFAEVAGRAAQLAHGLQALGVTGDQRVGTFMWNNQEHLEAYLAVPAMGAVLHTANIRLFPDQLIHTITEAEDQILIVDESLVPTLAPLLDRLPTVHTVIVNGRIDPARFERSGKNVMAYEDVLARRPTERAWVDGDEHDAATMCFTTGTTGNPKGVAYSHRSIAVHSMSQGTYNAVTLGFDDRSLIVVPMFHANAWGYPYTCWWFGADVVLLDRFMNAGNIVRAVEEQKVTFANGVPTVWNDVLSTVRAEPDRDLASLRMVIVGGAALARPLVEGFEQFGIRLVQGWGMTETSPLVTVAKSPEGAEPETEMSLRLSQGRILPGAEIRLVHPETLEILPADGEAIGEFELRGPWITGRYLGDEGTDKFHDGWLRTGDIGTLDEEGYVRITDRAKDVIKSGGEWVSSVELENAISAHPDVTMATVIGVPDPKWDERPCAVVVVREGADLDGEALRAWLTGRVARWWIPEYWSFVPEIPLTSVGKLDKKVLRQRQSDGALPVLRLTTPLPRDTPDHQV